MTNWPKSAHSTGIEAEDLLMGNFPGAGPYDQMRVYQEHDVAETVRLYDEVNDPRKTLHEFTVERDGVTVVVFNTKVVIVHENGDVQEFARAA
jgi:hypothetical protein